MAKTKNKLKKKVSIVTQEIQLPKVSFDWSPYLYGGLSAAPVTFFESLSLSKNWNTLVKNDLKIEVSNPDAVLSSNTQLINDCYWIASVVRVEGFFVCLRWQGETDQENDFWIHIYDPKIHPVGFAQQNCKFLLPPKNIANNQSDWKAYLRKHLIDKVTLPPNFRDQISDGLRTDFRKGLKLEAIDINRVSAVRSVVVVDVKGTRLQVGYDFSAKQYDFTNSLWCDQKSNLIHPVGWAQLVGHELKSTKHYAESSLRKIKTGQFDENDADFSYFPHLYEQMSKPYIENETLKFEKDMRVEVIDALNMKIVSVASVFKRLRYDYLMIGIDGLTSADGSDAICYHRSDCLPINYCKKYKIQLSKPEEYKKNFNYSTYLKDVNGQAAPEILFKDDLPDPDHCFEKGMYIESVDLMEPHLICPAYVKQVAGKLIKISFCGWADTYDQWVDYKSPEIYPIGYCFATDYMLESPKEMINNPLETSQSLNRSSKNVSINLTVKKPQKETTRGIKKKGKPVKSIKPAKPAGKSIKKVKQVNESDLSNLNNTSNGNLETTSNLDLETVSNVNLDKSQNVNLDKTSNAKIVLNTSYQENKIINESRNEAKEISKEIKSTISNANITNEQELDPLKWSVEDVKKFWIDNGLEEFCQIFVDNKIDGAKLLKIPGDGLFKLIKKLGPAIKMMNLLKDVKKKLKTTN